MPARRVPAALRAVPVADEPVNLSVGVGLVRPPTWMPARARREWRRIVEVCAVRPLWLQRADLAALSAYCMAWFTFQEAARDVASRGVVVPGRGAADQGRLVKNPSIAVMSGASESLRRWAIQLGFTPDARQKIPLGPEENHDSDDLWD